MSGAQRKIKEEKRRERKMREENERERKLEERVKKWKKEEKGDKGRQKKTEEKGRKGKNEEKGREEKLSKIRSPPLSLSLSLSLSLFLSLCKGQVSQKITNLFYSHIITFLNIWNCKVRSFDCQPTPKSSKKCLFQCRYDVNSMKKRIPDFIVAYQRGSAVNAMCGQWR